MNKLITSVVAVFAVITIGQSQDLPNWRPYDKTGLTFLKHQKIPLQHLKMCVLK